MLRVVGIECADTAAADRFAVAVAASLGGHVQTREERDGLGAHNQQCRSIREWAQADARFGLVVHSPDVLQALEDGDEKHQKLLSVQIAARSVAAPVVGHVYLRDPSHPSRHRRLEEWYRTMHDADPSRVLIFDPMPTSTTDVARAVETFRDWVELLLGVEQTGVPDTLSDADELLREHETTTATAPPPAERLTTATAPEQPSSSTCTIA